MNALIDELLQQPQALRDLVKFYRQPQFGLLNHAIYNSSQLIFTGIGASYHAAWIAALHLNSLGISAQCFEASDVINYLVMLLYQDPTLVYVSQSGESGEVAELLKLLPPKPRLAALTNHPDSRLALASQTVFQLCASEETLVASKTYLNSLALLWLLAKRWHSSRAGNEFDRLELVADLVEARLAQREAVTARWLETIDVGRGILFTGHGPHAATARQAAMMLSEWPKVPALSYGLAAFRHGFIEAVQPGMGAVVFVSAGDAQASAQRLAVELADYGLKVLLVYNGLLLDPGEALPPQAVEVDEFLASILDIVPVQLYADALAKARSIPPGFRHISKVVQKL